MLIDDAKFKPAIQQVGIRQIFNRMRKAVLASPTAYDHEVALVNYGICHGAAIASGDFEIQRQLAEIGDYFLDIAQSTPSNRARLAEQGDHP